MPKFPVEKLKSIIKNGIEAVIAGPVLDTQKGIIKATGAVSRAVTRSAEELANASYPAGDPRQGSVKLRQTFFVVNHLKYNNFKDMCGGKFGPSVCVDLIDAIKFARENKKEHSGGKSAGGIACYATTELFSIVQQIGLDPNTTAHLVGELEGVYSDFKEEILNKIAFEQGEYIAIHGLSAESKIAYIKAEDIADFEAGLSVDNAWGGDDTGLPLQVNKQDLVNYAHTALWLIKNNCGERFVALLTDGYIPLKATEILLIGYKQQPGVDKNVVELIDKTIREGIVVANLNRVIIKTDQQEIEKLNPTQKNEESADLPKPPQL